MPSYFYENRCIFEVLDGLREGLSHFSQPSRVALIYAVRRNDPLRIWDPQNLLHGHEPKLQELFLESAPWPEGLQEALDTGLVEPVQPTGYKLELAGLISFAGRSNAFFFQTWFTEHHPDMGTTGPTERWLEYAARLLSRNIASERIMNLGTSGYVLEEYATHAVRDYIVDRRNVILGWDTQLRIFPILDAVLGISKTLEEGTWPRGQLVFVEPNLLSKMNFLARFPELGRPRLKNFKHVRKLLLSVEDASRKLVSDGKDIIGITSDQLPQSSLVVDFRGGYGFLKLDDDPICSFADGRFSSSTRKANLVYVEEALLEHSMDSSARHDLFRIITQIVNSAGEGRHGCTLVVDPNVPVITLSGQNLERPLDLQDPNLLELSKSLAKVDGALHIGGDLKLHRFACLLDGHAVPGEDRARGARFNSALRFTAEHPELIVVVVSSDRPVSVIQGGLELSAQCEWQSPAGWLTQPPLLAEWIKG